MLLLAVVGSIAAAGSSGCATRDRWIERRSASPPLSQVFLWRPTAAPAFAPSTVRLAETAGVDPSVPEGRLALIARLEQEADTRRLPEVEFALSELAAQEAEQLRGHDPDAAVGFYAESLIHGFRALDGDPQSRIAGATARYNASLDALLRLLKERDAVQPGARIPLPDDRHACSIAVELHSERWSAADFHDFEFSDDFQVLGLRNHYHKTGVGVPLIGIRNHPDHDHAEDRFYPSKLCYPLTAFVRIDEPFGPASHTEGAPDPQGGAVCRTRLVLELHDPMDHDTKVVAGRNTTLASDLTTPLAYYLDQPELHEDKVSTVGLLNPADVKQLQGVYLLEPYDPNRVPVVMVHGLWSSPATWMEMFNDLRSDPRVRSRYQFWFYLYPTGNPFWVSASQMRLDLMGLRRTFDPENRSGPMSQTVLVGHSMGGLLSRLQTVDSRRDFWDIVAERPFEQLDADPEVAEYLSDIFFFRPDPSVRRVVTIGTPHRGSRFANGFTQWLGAKLIAFPLQTVAKRDELFRRNPGFFKPDIAARVMTSIDSLSPTSPLLAALLAAPAGPWVSYHNIVGDMPRTGVTAWYTNRGDGVVSLESARLDDLPQLESQVIVPEDHVSLHRHPQSIEEVRRILLEQLAEFDPAPAEASPRGVTPLGALRSARPVGPAPAVVGVLPAAAVAPATLTR